MGVGMTARHWRRLAVAAAALLLQVNDLSVLAAAQASPPATATQSARVNPLLSPSALPYGAPAFDTIRDGDFEPALVQGMAYQRAEIQRITSSSEPPTFQNTIEALERSGALLTRVSRVFNLVVQANTNPVLQQVDAAQAPKLAANRDATYLDAALFARVKRLYDNRASLGLEPDQLQLVERYYREFVRSGAALIDSQKKDLSALNQEQAELTAAFRKKVLADMNAAAPVFDRSSALDGLSPDDLAAAASAAGARGLQNKWVLPLQNTTQHPSLTFLKDRQVREQLFKASLARNSSGANDTTAIIIRLAQLRASRAKLLGFDSHAAFTLDNQMAKTPQIALKLLTDMVPAVRARVAAEATRIQQLIDSQHGGFTLQPWDWEYYAEQVRKADYDLDESQVRPYFEIDRVLREGVFFAATRLYGVTFKERKDVPVYHPDVRVFEVFDRDGSGLGLFYSDYFARPSKRGGAWTSGFVLRSGLLETKAVVTNTCNFAKPAPGAPALISFDEATTMFHEFGHALHALFSEARYPALAGSNVPRDFGEVPSQFNEHWALDPLVFSSYAKHYKTGAAMPTALEQKIRQTLTFNQGFATAELLAASLLDMGWHLIPASAPLPNVGQFESATLERYGMAIPQIPPRYSSRYFSHIWTNGYSAGYYSYLWSEVIETDAYYWFKEHGGMTRENGQRFRDMVLAPGSSSEVAALYRAFRGRDPDVEPLLIERGLRPAVAPR
jgi:peptidyl-dipeptidase Dcp